MLFKTNATATDCEAAVRPAIERKFPNAQFSVELNSADGVLHVHGIPEDSLHAAQVESAVKEAGFTASWLTRGLENK